MYTSNKIGGNHVKHQYFQFSYVFNDHRVVCISSLRFNELTLSFFPLICDFTLTGKPEFRFCTRREWEIKGDSVQDNTHANTQCIELQWVSLGACPIPSCRLWSRSLTQVHMCVPSHMCVYVFVSCICICWTHARERKLAGKFVVLLMRSSFFSPLTHTCMHMQGKVKLLAGRKFMFVILIEVMAADYYKNYIFKQTSYDDVFFCIPSYSHLYNIFDVNFNF